jgi:Ca2+-binding EF-hand superfamily protein
MKRSRKLMMTAMGLVVAGLAGNVQAAEIPDRGPIPFAAYDQNGDGKVSEAEFTEVRTRRMASRGGKGMRGMGKMPPFSNFDSNADGSLSPEELAAGQKMMQQRRGGMGMASGRGAGMGRGRGGNAPSFAEFDLNSDGRIPEEEFLKAQGQRISARSQAGYPMRNIGNIAVFSDMDSNGDGVLTPEEFSAGQMRHRQQNMAR